MISGASEAALMTSGSRKGPCSATRHQPIERLSATIKRRTDVVGIPPYDATVRRLVGAIPMPDRGTGRPALPPHDAGNPRSPSTTIPTSASLSRTATDQLGEAATVRREASHATPGDEATYGRFRRPEFGLYLGCSSPRKINSSRALSSNTFASFFSSGSSSGKIQK